MTTPACLHPLASLALLLLLGLLSPAAASPPSEIRFLLTVNDTWYPSSFGKQCFTYVLTEPLEPNKTFQQSPRQQVGTCDSGPLIWAPTDKGIWVSFQSSVIEDASPPECYIPYSNASTQTIDYVLPVSLSNGQIQLPSCSKGDSREGYHMTYYWFSVFSWT